jgi:hypothetical protein
VGPELGRGALIATVSPVLQQGGSDQGGPFFLAYDKSAIDLDIFVRAFRHAQKNALKGAHIPECMRDVFLSGDGMCRDPAKTFAQLDWRRLEGVSFYDVDDLTSATFFFRRALTETPNADHVHVEIGAYVHGTEAQISSVKISGVTYVD